ncbi:MAG TPA: HAMP domain-containing sensor histidine kinase [Actinomycetes bacterium]|nr:HAMP domain-containing sensor histidine kinase [Actinomycetes bacterium]
MTAAFALATLALALILSLLTYTLSSAYLLRQREASAQRQAFVNARLVQSGLRSGSPVPELLDSLETPATSESVLAHHSRWFASSPLVVGRDELPAQLRERVSSGTAARQRFRLAGVPQLAVGVPLPQVRATYFEVFSLAELDRTLHVLAGALLAGAAVTVLLGIGFGRWVSGQVLRPLADVSRAARSISKGRLDTRLDPAQDSDLAVLSSSFNTMADALEQRIERDARFASDVSHELRSPLTTLATAVAVLHDRRGGLPEPARDAVDLLQLEVERFQRMVLELLEISRLDAGVVELVLEEVRPAELVRRAVGAVRAATPGELADGSRERAPIEVRVDDDADELVIQADKRRMEQVMANLVNNAETHGGGLAGISVVRAGGRVRVLVDDAGPGVAPAYRGRIFERFSRAPVTAGSRRDGGGVGLGLALVAEHVRVHGGQVWVEERPGGGARFVVELPAEAP